MDIKANIRRALKRSCGPLEGRDVFLACAIAVAAGIFSFLLARCILEQLYDFDAFDLWFEADLPRIFQLMTHRVTGYATRAELHPLFHIVTYSMTRILTAMGIESMTAVHLVFAGFSGVWLSCLFLVIRVIGCKRLDAVMFTMLGLSSASAIFFFAVPETFLLGSITILFALLLAAGDEQGEGSKILEAFVSAATLSITVTNWMFGLLTTLYRRRIRTAVQISINAFIICVLLWSFQKYLFPESEFFLGATYAAERSNHILSPEALGLRGVVMGFFAHSMVMPEIQLVDRPSSGAWPILLTQPSVHFSSGLPGNIALASWLALFAGGMIALTSLRHQTRFRILLGSVLVGQFLLHLFFGNETFLYSMHWVPVLVIVASIGSLTRYRPIVLFFAILFILSAGANNLLQFRRSLAFIESYQPIVQERKEAESRKSRQDDPWPQSAIRVNGDGFRAYDEAAYEPGGGLWPATDTFNIGFWVMDSGNLIATSHNLGPHTTTQQSIMDDGGLKISAANPHYLATWRCTEPRVWHLKLEPSRKGQEELYLMVRGVDWEYSRIYSLRIDGTDLIINNRWRLSVEPAVEKMEIGTEGETGWTVTTDREAKSAGGWGFARIGPLRADKYRFVIEDEGRNGSVDVILGTIPYASPDPGIFKNL